MRTASVALVAAVIFAGASGWISYGVGWSNGWKKGATQGRMIGVLNCEQREMCDRFLPAARSWLAELERKNGTYLGDSEPSR